MEIMGNVVSGGTADTTGTITLNGNEVTVKNVQPNCRASQGVSLLPVTRGPLTLTNFSASTIRL